MSANIYNIADLLVGKVYRSGSIEGEIISAEKHPKDVWYGRDTESFLIQVKDKNSIYPAYRTVGVVTK